MILDDENILIEKARESVDPFIMLDAVLGDYKITGSILTKSGDDLFKILPCFSEYEWVRYSNRLSMCHINTRRTILAIDFDKMRQYYSSKYEYECMVRVIIYSNYCTFSIHDYFKSLFKLDDELLWKCEYVKGFEFLKSEPYTIYKRLNTIYKKIKYN